VDVVLDAHLVFTDTFLNRPYTFLGNNTYRFPLGEVVSGSSGSLYFKVYVDCDSTAIGQTLCSAAHIYPDSLCVEIPDWSGAQVIVSAYCEQDTAIRFEIKNTGFAPSGLLEYIIIEDDIVLMEGHDSYDPGQTRAYTLPANGHFRRMEVDQEPGHPFSQKASAWVENCGGTGSGGFVNWYFLGDGIPSQDVACTEIKGSYDPNDKQGFPLGYGADHRIRPGQDLEYLIRFQNTGTDTAFTVVIRDTLSAWLDPASVRPGAASHPYTWALSGQGLLTFTFVKILLPDSTTNLAGSQGFVSFHIAQQPDVPLETKIGNTADIYFDFNAPIITNQTLHTVGFDFLTGTDDPPALPARLFAVQVSPNPVVESTTFRLTEGAFRQHVLTLTDALGRTVRQSRISGNQFVFERQNLPAGIYAYRVEDVQGRLVEGGKVVLK